MLHVEKGWCHFSHEGTKDFLDFITAYQPEKDGISFEVSTFRGKTARVMVTFVSDTAFRFQMFPGSRIPRTMISPAWKLPKSGKKTCSSM